MIDLANILEKITADKKKLVLAGIIAVSLVYADFTLILSAQMRAVNNTKASIAKFRRDLENLDRELGLMRENKLGSENLADKSELKKTIPEGQVSVLLQGISDSANKNKIKIMQMKPTYEARPEKAAGEPKLYPLFIGTELICDYHSLGRFIGDLETSPYFMAVDEMKIGSEQNNFMQQRVYLLIRAYAKK